MDAQIDFFDRGDYLEVVFHGAFSLANHKIQVPELLKACKRYGKKVAFCDLTQQKGTMTIVERYQLGTFVAGFWDRTIRLSILVHPDHHTAGDLFEDVTHNRGLNFRVFIDRERALAYAHQPEGANQR